MRRLLALLLVIAAPSVARADWIVTPFVGTTFGASTNIVFVTAAGNKKFNFGGSFGFLSDGVLGIETSASHIPRFYEAQSGPNVVLNSGITTLDGNVIVAVPQAITGYSLRPYVVSGVGLMHVSSQGLRSTVNSFDSNLLALNIGGGAIGMLSNRSGVRFEIRKFRDLKPDDSAFTLSGESARTSFWRATVGVLFRF